MKISTEASHLYTSQRAQTLAAKNTDPTPFSSALATATAEAPAVKQADFTSMTR